MDDIAEVGAADDLLHVLSLVSPEDLKELAVRGDELVNVMVYIPEKLSAAEKSAIESLRNSPNVTPGEEEKRRIFSKLTHIFD